MSSEACGFRRNKSRRIVPVLGTVNAARNFNLIDSRIEATSGMDRLLKYPFIAFWRWTWT
jgi:hypothetical protein